MLREGQMRRQQQGVVKYVLGTTTQRKEVRSFQKPLDPVAPLFGGGIGGRCVSKGLREMLTYEPFRNKMRICAHVWGLKAPARWCAGSVLC